MKQRWWSNDARERYWMESTDRPLDDIGGPLANWMEREDGSRNAPAGLLDEMDVDDIVFHYHTPQQALVGYSSVVSNRASRERPGDRPWIERKIGGLESISPPVTLVDIREQSSRIFDVMDAIKDGAKGPYFLPIIKHRGAAAPPTAYMSKMPREVADLLELLRSADTSACPIGIPRTGPKPPPRRPATADPFQTDPDKIDRGTKAHRSIENALAAFVVERGARTRDPARREPPFDLAWWIGGQVWIAEVKSTTVVNERAQLRYGLGQLLRYAQDFAGLDPRPNLVLVVERPVEDPAWIETCGSVGVTLTWQSAFDERLVTPDVPAG